jgi:hypothetical protein
MNRNSQRSRFCVRNKFGISRIDTKGETRVLGRSIAYSAITPGTRSIPEPVNTRNIRIRFGPGKNIQPETIRAAFESEIAFSRRIASKNSRRKRTVDSSFLRVALQVAVEKEANQPGGAYTTCFSIA